MYSTFFGIAFVCICPLQSPHNVVSNITQPLLELVYYWSEMLHTSPSMLGLDAYPADWYQTLSAQHHNFAIAIILIQRFLNVNCVFQQWLVRRTCFNVLALLEGFTSVVVWTVSGTRARPYAAYESCHASWCFAVKIEMIIEMIVIRTGQGTYDTKSGYHI